MTRAAAISPSLAAFRRKSVPTGRSPSRALSACRLKIAAKVDKADEAYFREMIAPLLDRPGVEFVGEINDRDKDQISRRRIGAAVSDRLARAVRTGDDRGDGVRDAGARRFAAARSPKSRRSRHRASRRDVDEAIRVLPRGASTSIVARSGDVSKSAFRLCAWRATISTSISILAVAPPPMSSPRSADRTKVIALPRKSGVEHHAN